MKKSKVIREANRRKKEAFKKKDWHNFWYYSGILDGMEKPKRIFNIPNTDSTTTVRISKGY